MWIAELSWEDLIVDMLGLLVCNLFWERFGCGGWEVLVSKLVAVCVSFGGIVAVGCELLEMLELVAIGKSVW